MPLSFDRLAAPTPGLRRIFFRDDFPKKALKPRHELLPFSSLG